MVASSSTCLVCAFDAVLVSLMYSRELACLHLLPLMPLYTGTYTKVTLLCLDRVFKICRHSPVNLEVLCWDEIFFGAA